MTRKDLVKRLYGYNVDRARLENLKMKLEELELNTSMAINYSERVQSSGISNPTLNAVMEKEAKEEEIRTEIRTLGNKIRAMDNAIGALTSIEREIIRGRYLEGLQFWQVCSKVGYSSRRVCELQKSGLEKMMDALR